MTIMIGLVRCGGFEYRTRRWVDIRSERGGVTEFGMIVEHGSRRFDLAASTYDRRTRIPPTKCEEIARAVVSLSRAARGDALLELGAGTGQIGIFFPETGVRYTGLDVSAPMLAVFKERCGNHSDRYGLVHADVNQSWPVSDASVRCIFSSRAVHLFDKENVLREAGRVALETGAALVLGRVERDPDSVRQQLKLEKRARLADRGFLAVDGEGRQRNVLAQARAQGAEPFAAKVAATWQVRHRAGDVLSDWSETPGLGGSSLPAGVKKELLADLRRFAQSRFGSLDTFHESEDRYVLEGVWFRR